MSNPNDVTPEDRGKLVLKWRTTIGWNIGEVAKRVGVSTRTISAIESAAQVMPEPRWRLFVHELIEEIDRDQSAEIVVVLGAQQVPIDVVSSENYAGYALADDGKTGVIASYSVSRLTGAPEMHRQRFLVQPNKHVIDAAERWEYARQDATPDRAAFEMQRWIMRRVLKGEIENPRLEPLKAAIRLAKEKLDMASGASDEIRAQHMRELDTAVANLMEEVAKTTRNGAA